MAERVDLGDHYFEGEDKRIRFRIWTDPTKTVRRNITGWALSWMVKKKYSHVDSSALVVQTTALGTIVITDGPQGEGYIENDDADIVDVVGGILYYHELRRTDAGANTVLFEGTLLLNRAVHDVAA